MGRSLSGCALVVGLVRLALGTPYALAAVLELVTVRQVGTACCSPLPLEEGRELVLGHRERRRVAVQGRVRVERDRRCSRLVCRRRWAWLLRCAAG